MKSTIIFHAIFIIQLFTFIGCASSTGPIDSTGGKKIWTPVTELSNIYVNEIKIINDELYIAGRTDDHKGVLYKSVDGEKWFSAMPTDNIFTEGLVAIDTYHGKIIGTAPYKPICIIEKDTVIQISPVIKIFMGKMITTEKGIFIAAGSNRYLYDCVFFSNDSLTYVQNHLNTYNDNECIYEGSIIKPIEISKLLREKNSANERILVSNTVTYNFVTSFSNGTIDCFPNKGLSINDKYSGCLDMMYIGDTLYACTMGRIVYYDNSREWKTFGDSLPKAYNHYPTALAITYDELQHTMYVGTNYSGVLKWKGGKGWESFNDGINPLWGAVFATMSDLIYFKGNLFLAYGGERKWTSLSTGVLKMKL